VRLYQPFVKAALQTAPRLFATALQGQSQFLNSLDLSWLGAKFLRNRRVSPFQISMAFIKP
jgi:hypothetical protein